MNKIQEEIRSRYYFKIVKIPPDHLKNTDKV